MKRCLLFLGLLVTAMCVVMPSSASADASHARIVRLSLIQGDVRFARSFHDDPLTEGNATWEQAPLNLPIREGYVLATGSGRASVEFESGAMAFMSANTVLEFYDLSLHDGGRITRLVLRQGTASFYVSPLSGDYFSVTGGDFTAEANSKSSFRMDNFDDGSTVKVLRGSVAVLHKEHSTSLQKGQSLSVQAESTSEPAIGRAGEKDDFDRWVSGRIDSQVAALNSSFQYTGVSDYTAGFADLYTFGSWFPMGGYGSCWRPFGAGFGWSPFSFGDWYQDPAYGWTFIGSAAWGWLPYHYGGWISSPMYGWCWNPAGFGYGYGNGYRRRPAYWRPVTAVWVHSGTRVGVVPIHPRDKSWKTPMNLGRGVYPVEGHAIGQPVAITSTEKWSPLKQAPRGILPAGFVPSAAPTRVSRSLYAGNMTGRETGTLPRNSIAFNAQDHRFVSSSNLPSSAKSTAFSSMKAPTMGKDVPRNGLTGQPANVPHATLPPRSVMTPPPAHSSGGGGSRSGSGYSGGAGAGGSHGSGGSSGSGGFSGSGGSSGSSHPSGGSSGGGHPR